MKNKSIAEIKQIIDENNLSDSDCSDLQRDSRKGVQKLWKAYEQGQKKEKELELHFLEMCQYEHKNYTNGCEYIAGIDEAGRGPLAGPVVAAAVILPRNFKLLGLDDSKLLNEHKRNEFFTLIKEQAISFGISIVSNQKIDQVNIYEATKIAMRDALSQLDPCPDHVLIDAVPLEHLPCTSESITKGDQKSITIAAASVLAKVTRDTIMKKIHKDFPFYDFESNMGYGTKHHMDALKQHGSTPFHRKSFAPVKNTFSG
ncbi:ribonuclease HII [Virgibacillus necropolis]|uniref:Ribonuclease HII n=1 Tax=Virgibacillus necropolis TaxID=163877 RepID=A0A221MDJ7_9BACI|nr:ribonuclease HII [Virgibacillus necropolis]ASN05743.1 ribonuclease HII [Virgibacillus necropolis]